MLTHYEQNTVTVLQLSYVFLLLSKRKTSSLTSGCDIYYETKKKYILHTPVVKIGHLKLYKLVQAF